MQTGAPDTDTLLAVAYESMRARSSVTAQQFSDAFHGWDMVPVMVGEDLAGVVMSQGPEIHACILPAYFGRWLSRSVLRRTVLRVLAEHGRATTTVSDGNPVGEEFVSRLGFLPVSSKNGVTTYELKR